MTVDKELLRCARERNKTFKTKLSESYAEQRALSKHILMLEKANLEAESRLGCLDEQLELCKQAELKAKQSERAAKQELKRTDKRADRRYLRHREKNKEELKKLEHDISQLVAEQQSYTNELDKARSEYNKLLSEHKMLADQNERLLSEHKKLTDLVSELEHKLSEVESKATARIAVYEQKAAQADKGYRMTERHLMSTREALMRCARGGARNEI
ncbi:hypothetical protein BCT19_01255 [Vibrio splendidus]|uniref:hypothetical protein n=1 Tax=Vibrio splendidus TaxID=29497 RepID=UPI000C83ABD1|nr:hypothetical protein [Vibrio splendidus]PMO04339.1 hypothetical protein BCT19_01255 [Vibrio splendidus]